MKRYTVITGASSGIGYASAIKFAQRGDNVILVARRESRLEELQEEILQINPNIDCIYFALDLSIMENCYKLYNQLADYDIKTWINNAGFGVYGKQDELPLDKLQDMLHLNIEAVSILSTLFIRDYKNKDDTQLINVSSAGGYTIVQGAVAYCATKFFVSSFSEGLAMELDNEGAKMKVKVLAPFLTKTEFAEVANNDQDFKYEDKYEKFHTSEEVAQFLIDLYESDNCLGIVSREDFAFTLCDYQFKHSGPSK
ncbi:SDR family NAD(P)-dependent oxidoreductase [Breznakia pachnodae]|uniref:Short-subunit dehydrogenase n=1 Tax=Breznakia pachnodae TaxID=265178 RepID=A0ABU0E783_9FIRM|nr:SDR family NAD(P)-dependent oxidoreductase [Breznakia pachnodae]MDQ0362761.1 short-subunit dehydrogenase [Breznakia pachnodae]